MAEEMRTESGRRRRTWMGDGEGMVGRRIQWVCHPLCGAGASPSLSPLLPLIARPLSPGHTRPARDGPVCAPPDNAPGVTGYHGTKAVPH